MKIQDSVPSLDLNTWFLDDGTLVGTIPELRQAIDIFQETGPSRGLILSTTHTARVPKTTLWCSTDVTGNNDPLDRGVPRVRGLGITLLGAPLGHTGYESEFIREKIDKIRQITSLLPDLQDAHSEFSLLRSCLSLPKFIFVLRTVDTSPHRPLLDEFDQITREGMSRILGFPLSPLQWDQTKLPVTMAGLGIRSANDHAASAYSTSFLQSQHLTQKLLNLEVNSPQASLGHDVLLTLSTQLSEEITAESLVGLTQKMLSKRIDAANLTHFTNKIQDSGVREVARLAALSSPQSGAWLQCPPIPALGLHLRTQEFVVAVKFRLGIPVYNQPGICPACGRESDTLGDHGLVCGYGGERISRHHSLRDSLFATAQAAGLSPQKEVRGLLPGTDLRPADVLIPRWTAGRDTALDVSIIHPFQQATCAREANDPGFSLRFAYDNKMRGTAELCRQQGIEFLPIIANSVGGWHNEALNQFKKLGSALSRNTGTDESVCIGQVISKNSLLLQKGLCALILNRSPNIPPPPISGSM